MTTTACCSAAGIGVFVAVTSACSFYDRPKHTATASIMPDYEVGAAGDAYMYIEKFDGARVAGFWSIKPSKRVRSESSDFSVMIAAGMREVITRLCVVTTFKEHRCTRARLHLSVLPSSDYQIRARFTQELDAADLWIEDTTGSLLGAGIVRTTIQPCSDWPGSPLQAYISCDLLEPTDVDFSSK